MHMPDKKPASPPSRPKFVPERSGGEPDTAYVSLRARYADSSTTAAMPIATSDAAAMRGSLRRKLFHPSHFTKWNPANVTSAKIQVKNPI